MRRPLPLVLIRVLAAAFVVLASVGSAQAHFGHFSDASVARDSPATGVAHDAQFLAAALPHRLELHAPGCPGNGSGNCCCTQDAHASLPSSQFALRAPATAIASIVPVACRLVPMRARPALRPIVIGSRGSRGPPSV